MASLHHLLIERSTVLRLTTEIGPVFEAGQPLLQLTAELDFILFIIGTGLAKRNKFTVPNVLFGNFL